MIDFFDNLKERKTENFKGQERGRSGIGDMKRIRYSSRAISGRLSVIEKKCPYCGHHKALQNTRNIRCSRCKREVEE